MLNRAKRAGAGKGVIPTTTNTYSSQMLEYPGFRVIALFVYLNITNRPRVKRAIANAC